MAERQKKERPKVKGFVERGAIDPKKLKIYYDGARNFFWFKNRKGKWVSLGESSMGKVLKRHGVLDYRTDVGLSPLKNMLLDIQLYKTLDFAGELGGYQAGIHKENGNTLLITKGPLLHEPTEGPFFKLEKFFSEFFGDQKKYFFGWLARSVRTLYAGPPFLPGHAIVLAGAPGAGKSHCQAILTSIFGGRSTKPFDWIKGKENYSGNVFKNEHLMIEDESPHIDLATRMQIGAKIKSLIANESQNVRAMWREAQTLKPFVRVSISVNDDANHLQVLPPLEDSFNDKIMIFSCSAVNYPFDEDDLKGRENFHKELLGEIPHFIHWLKQHKPPKEIADRRWGVKHWHHPTILEKIASLSPESALLDLVDTLEIVAPHLPIWIGTSSKLEADLRAKDKGRQTGELLRWPTACGQYLAKLAKKFPKRITHWSVGHNKQIWAILPEGGEMPPEIPAAWKDNREGRHFV